MTSRLLLITLLSLGLATSSVGALENNALPTGGVVEAGSATITQSTQQLTVDQSSQQAILGWESFNVGVDASVHFNHQLANSSTLNNIHGASGSVILGDIYSNGQLIISNPNGISFGPNSTVQTEGLIASTLSIANQDYLNQQYTFTGSSDQPILQQGILSGGYVALVGPTINQQGTIQTTGDTVLAASDQVTLSLSADHALQVTTQGSEILPLIDQEGTITSSDGSILLSVDATQQVLDETIQSGQAEANQLVSENGVIKLISSTGHLTAQQSIQLEAQDNAGVEVSGHINTNSATASAGNIQVTGKEVTIKSTASLEAKGATGGGEILVGGSWQNTDPSVQQATYTTAEAGSVIDASATENGDGGTVVLWSGISNSNSLTKANGIIYSKGGAEGGSGGFVETSGSILNIDGITVSTLAFDGSANLWLLDPYNFFFSTADFKHYFNKFRISQYNFNQYFISTSGH